MCIWNCGYYQEGVASCGCNSACDCDNRYLSATVRGGLRVCAACKRKHATLAEIADTCNTRSQLPDPAGQPWSWSSNGIPARSAAE